MKKFQIFLVLIVSLFLTGCVVSKKQMEKEVDLRDLQVQKLQAKLEEFSKEYDSLLSKVRSLEKKSLELNKEISKLNGTVEEKDKEIEKFSMEKGEWQQTEKGLIKDIGLLKEEVGSLEKEILKKEARIKTLGESLIGTEKSGQEAQEAINRNAQEAINRLREENEKIAGEFANLQVTVKEEKGKLTITMLDKILFDSGKAEIKKEALPVLGKLAEIINKYPKRDILIQGHTDNVPISTPLFPSNWELSTRRATTVLQYFVGGRKISPKRFSAAGYGEYQPVVGNSTAEERAKNRRVEVILLPPDFSLEKEKFQ